MKILWTCFIICLLQLVVEAQHAAVKQLQYPTDSPSASLPSFLTTTKAPPSFLSFLTTATTPKATTTATTTSTTTKAPTTTTKGTTIITTTTCAPTRANYPTITSNNLEQCGRLNEKYLYNRKTKTAFDEYPWLGRVSYTDNNNGGRHFRCLAVLINAQHIIAPAHCVLDTGELEAFSVVFGDWNATDDISTGDCNAACECAAPPEEYEFSEIAVHPNYDSTEYDNDISVIRLTRPVQFSAFIAPICLLPAPEPAPEVDFVAQRLECVGFPAKSLFFRDKVRQKAHVQTTSWFHCRRIYDGRIRVSVNHICAYIQSEVNFMTGTALLGVNVVGGEPRNFYLIGIATVGSREKNYDVPDIFMRIWPYREWILENSS